MKENRALEARINDLERTLEGRTRELRAAITDLQKAGPGYATKGDIEHLTEKMRSYVQLQHIKDLEQRVVPPVNRVTGLITQFARDNKDMRCCVRSFDELLCQKVNK